MVAIAQRSPRLVVLGDPAVAEPAARELARRYLAYVSALWRGDLPAPEFGAWLNAYRCPTMPPVPLSPPDAVSPHGGGGRGIRWYETPTTILGYVPGERGGYRVPVATLRAAPSSVGGRWERRVPRSAVAGSGRP